MYEGLARKLILSITPEDIDKASMLQKVTASGIAFDKMRLLRGESTANLGLHARILHRLARKGAEDDL